MNLFRRRRRQGRFQPYSHTLPDRYPWLFRFAADAISDGPDVRLLSFGCSKGDEVLALRTYFPKATIKGIDIDPRNIAQARARASRFRGVEFSIGSNVSTEEAGSYDAIFCLAVLCHGDLVRRDAVRSDPLMHFVDFDRTVGEFARCLKPGGVLFLHTTNFRICDSSVAAAFAPILEAAPDQMAPDAQFGRDNQRIVGERYRAVAFLKREAFT